MMLHDPPRVPTTPAPQSRPLSGLALREYVSLAAGAELVLWVPYDLGASTANRTRGRHWGKRAQEDGKAELAALAAWSQAGHPEWGVPVEVEVLVFRGAELDEDNARSGLKKIYDALFKRRITPDDTPRWVRSGRLRQVTGPEWAGAACWVVLFVRKREGE